MVEFSSSSGLDISSKSASPAFGTTIRNVEPQMEWTKTFPA
jgi:hypothetical protein